jgi:hypothetical protein
VINVDYDFYTKKWQGELTQDKFNLYLTKVAQYVDYVTINRINDDNIIDNVKFCICELIDFYNQVSLNNDNIISEKIGDVQVQYNNNTQSEILSAQYNICLKWLVRPVNFMYKGVLLL